MGVRAVASRDIRSDVVDETRVTATTASTATANTTTVLCVGDLHADVTIETPHGIVVGSDVAGSVWVSGGGSAANVGAAVARSGCSSRFAGIVGDDVLADVVCDGLSSSGVDVRAIRRSGAATRSIAAIVGHDGDRSMVSDLSTDTVLTVDDVDTDWFAGVDHLHLTAYTYFPRRGREAFARLVELARSHRITWSIDPSSAAMLASECDRDEVAEAFAGASVVFPSGDESEWLSGESDPLLAAVALLDLAETVVVTCGASGAVVAGRGSDATLVPAESGRVVNALGCGDAFAGGFLAGRLKGLDVMRCVRLGHVAAARVLAIHTAR